MRPICVAILVVLLAAATSAHAERVPGRHFALTNATYDSVISLSIAFADSRELDDIELGEPLRGGITGITIEIPDGGCLRDFRVTFKDGRRLLYPAIDVCRHHGLRLRASDGMIRDDRRRASKRSAPT